MTRRQWLGGLGASSMAVPQTARRLSVALLIVDSSARPLSGATRSTRAYAADPEADPALASILTGRFPSATGVLRNGLLLAAGERCLAAELTRAGYRTVYAGPWPLGTASPVNHGFAEWRRDVGTSLAGARPFFLHIHAAGRDPADLVKQATGAGDLAVLVSLHGREPGTPLEPSVRVTLQMVGAPPALTPDGLISQVDLMPTALALCGVTVPAGLHGRDLTRARAESVFAQGALRSPSEWRMVVRGLDKLVVDSRLEATHLYNLGQDPSEENNLASDPSQQRTRDELRAHLLQWMRRAGDNMDPSGLKVRG
jgi:arylsulfatase A-like enzyme